MNEYDIDEEFLHMTTTKRTKDELRLELAKLQEWDNLVHLAMPPGGNANQELLQKSIGDNIRAIKKELGE